MTTKVATDTMISDSERQTNHSDIPSLFDALKHNPMFAGLDSYAFGVVENYLTFRVLNAGEILFFEGERGDFVAVVVAGRLDILKKIRSETTLSPTSHDAQTDNKSGQQSLKKMTRLASIKAGDSIGEMAIIDEMARSATVRAVERTGLVILPKTDFDHILQDHPRIGIDILKGIATMLSINLRRTSESLSKERPVTLSGKKI